MEQSTFQGKWIKSATEAAAMRVHSKEEPPDFGKRMIRVYKLGTDKIQQRVVFHVLIADGCLFYGNDALRRRGGCCICLLMASGLTAKRFSIWLGDAEQGEFFYSTFSKRLKLAVLIILPRLFYTLRPCVRPSEMDDRHGGHENTEKDFLTYSVRQLSRLHVGKINGQEILWKLRPPNWPKHLSWKNPTSSPKDSKETLMEKYEYLRSQISNEQLTGEEQKAFQDFEKGDIKNVKSFMFRNKWTDQINKMRKGLRYLQPSDLALLERNLTLLSGELILLLSSPTASASSCPTAAATSLSSTISRKRRSYSLTSMQSKKRKAETVSCDNYFKCREKFPKSTLQTAYKFSTVSAPSTVVSQSPAVESSLRYTAFLNQPQSSFVISKSLMANTCPNTLQCTASPCNTEAATAKIQPSTAASSSKTTFTNCNPIHCRSHEDLLKKVSLTRTVLSVDSGAWSQDSNSCKETCDIRIDKQKLSDENVQSDLQSILDSYNAVCDKNDSATVQDEDFDSKNFSCF